jgi:hypothetical protein
MISFLTTARVVALSAMVFSATAAFGREAIEDALGGPLLECSGAIAWTENDSSVMRVEPMRLAVRDVEGADRIAIFLSEEDFTSDNVWSC